jgi:hypothetical protein
MGTNIAAGLIVAAALALMWLGRHGPPVAPERPKAPPEPDAFTEALGQGVAAVAGLMVTLAGLCWLLILLGIFLAPLALVLAWVVR